MEMQGQVHCRKQNINIGIETLHRNVDRPWMEKCAKTLGIDQRKTNLRKDTRDTRIETVYRYKDKDRDYGQRLELLQRQGTERDLARDKESQRDREKE